MAFSYSLLKRADSLSLVEAMNPRNIKPVNAIIGPVIEPVRGDFKLSIPKINAIPATCPMSNRKPFEVPSETG